MSFLVQGDTVLVKPLNEETGKFMLTKAAPSSAGERIAVFPALNKMNISNIVHDIEEYVCAFDESMRIVHDIIMTDIWPRFIKSTSYANAVKNYGSTADMESS